MKYARNVFIGAGVWGLILVTPLYFMLDVNGRQYPPPITHPEWYFGFLSVTMVWQVTFLAIASNPVRYRPMMPMAVLEKFVYLVTMAALYAAGHLQLLQLAIIAPDGVLGILFVTAFLKTPRDQPVAAASSPSF